MVFITKQFHPFEMTWYFNRLYMLSKDFKIHSFMPPGISILSGVTYVVPGWHIVPENTTLKEVMEHWTQDLPYTDPKPNKTILEIVDSSKGNKKYKVSFDGRWWNCSCPGFGFRRSCQHVKTIKEKYK